MSSFLQTEYHLKQLGPNSFACQKLSKISVRIYSMDEANQPMPPVLLSLSGEDGYRNNTISESGGFFLFDNLFPGNFYLRPLLKVAISTGINLIHVCVCENLFRCLDPSGD